LVLLDGKTGETITTEGRSTIELGSEAFPFTKEAIQICKDKKNSKLISLFKDWTIFGNEADPSFLKSKEAVAIFIGRSSGDGAEYVFPCLKEAFNAL
jgi:hypothetical protein